MYYSQVVEKLDVNEMSSTKLPQIFDIPKTVGISHYTKTFFPKSMPRNPRSSVNKAGP